MSAVCIRPTPSVIKLEHHDLAQDKREAQHIPSVVGVTADYTLECTMIRDSLPNTRVYLVQARLAGRREHDKGLKVFFKMVLKPSEGRDQGFQVSVLGETFSGMQAARHAPSETLRVPSLCFLLVLNYCGSSEVSFPRCPPTCDDGRRRGRLGGEAGGVWVPLGSVMVVVEIQVKAEWKPELRTQIPRYMSVMQSDIKAVEKSFDTDGVGPIPKKDGVVAQLGLAVPCSWLSVDMLHFENFDYPSC
ncbi:hypothetical protein DPEC_G00150590 [Dallia pectoralis]|uniref:Uncharacterized protein n=1 Tax=Dallia pectoralis TaxID=75939 RepID=A0ACC2GJ78_DALPE|nr:hypothetical protein DPEC_G00150590 [Dallia pectoralis]